MISYAVAVLLGLMLCAIAVTTAWLVKKEMAQEKKKAFDGQALYESGENAARKRDSSHFKTPIDQALQKAGIQISPILFCLRVLCCLLLFGIFAALLAKKMLVGIASFVLAGTLVILWLKQKTRQRRELFALQFAGILPQLSTSMKGSSTFERALKTVAEYADDPLQSGLREVLADVSYGVSMSDALHELSQRSGNADVATLAAAIQIQEKFGGSIVPVIEAVSKHADASLKAQREIRTELAGTKLAKWFVAGSMPAIFLMMYLSNEQFKQFYHEEPLGWLVLGFALVVELLGLWLCNRITRCESVS